MENQTMLQVSEITLSYRPQIRPLDRPKVTSSKLAYELLLSTWDMGKIEFTEEFKVMLLNRNCKVLGIYTVCTGGISRCLVDVKLIFASALVGCASGIILSHNHPSGNVQPSAEDLSLTKRICEAGKLLELQVLDHIIVTVDGYYSFGDEALI